MAHIPAPFPAHEEDRILSLEHLKVLDSAPEQGFDDVVLLATTLCDAPIALVSLIDRERQWFKACIGLDISETHRDLAFCAHAILEPSDVLVVEDATTDPRFRESPLVLGPPYIRFYAGAPIRDESGYALGTVCIIDIWPRVLSDQQRAALLALARQTAALLQYRLLNDQREKHAAALELELENAQNQSQALERNLRHSQRVSSLGMLTASIAHDFNNLLQALSASLQLIHMRSRRPIDVETFSNTGMQAVEHGRQLVTRLLTSVRHDGPELICIDVSERLDAARDLLFRSVGDQLTLSFDLSARGWGVMCVEAQLHAAVLNLLANARDAMSEPGKAHIATRVESIRNDSQLQQGDYVVLSVTDDGPGMTADLKDQILEPFFTTKQAGLGTGLGLAQVQEFAVNAGGAVRIETSEGAGTTLHLYLRILGRINSTQG
ncbi:GAF:ATP-binding region, ATPase-like:histidine kinase A [Pseudomonas cannabina pv. alisalensis]|uniref:histidine kinase n=2 Tax=Pseudomonas cannabina TaxID=86840 RepID=A0AB37QE02_PSECA|nr:ATP-binding protein [Pseudomonas cannabina]KPW25620.1 GAF:ATP-binding region, ATPase-like:histidine kinase A [Pseudomonas cannabina pv. alisalensis]MBM0137997.1 GAF domain-containing protein [Pseudomonas cannabina pv. alisalensis]RMN75273.1 GAF:ATP-binding region, ATPase-like:histidine kinase A [Pseudomonas cannabina pv. alisalensis]RMN83208.1 GAF:ATP-binding region, ATPase-like:histidine kinase A [Pseudomonas cannabina]